jgi:hypothetical protein
MSETSNELSHVPYEGISPELLDNPGRIKAALELAMQDGAVDGSHHKMWVIDQMVRILTGSPVVTISPTNGVRPYTCEVLGESEAYQAFVAEHNDGEEGPDTYEWDAGIAP